MTKREIRSPVPVSDAALLQWLSRVERFDVEELRRQLGRAALVGVDIGASAVIVGSGKLLIDRGGVSAVVRRGDYPVRLIGRIEASVASEIVLYRRAKRRSAP